METGRDTRLDAVIQAVFAIPRGRVSSYGDVARVAGLPGRARWVGRVLRETDVDDLPWHRVLRADGQPGFPGGSPESAHQLELLAAEGVAIRNGRVPPEFFLREEGSLDRMLWGPDAGSVEAGHVE